MKIINVIALTLLTVIVIAIGGYFYIGYYLSSHLGYEFLFVHPTMAKIFNVTPICSPVCAENGGVCGKNEKTYCNKCVAFQHGAGYAHDGACVKPTPVVDPTASWKVYTDSKNGFEFKYPVTFSGVVWRAQTWPPVASVINGDLATNEICSKSSSSGALFIASASIEKVGNYNFVVMQSTDAGAGQLYSDYCYVLSENNINYVLHFVVHSTNGCGNGNCGPYCGTPNELACKNFDMQKEVVQPIEKIVSTFKFTK